MGAHFNRTECLCVAIGVLCSTCRGRSVHMRAGWVSPKAHACASCRVRPLWRPPRKRSATAPSPMLRGTSYGHVGARVTPTRCIPSPHAASRLQHPPRSHLPGTLPPLPSPCATHLACTLTLARARIIVIAERAVCARVVDAAGVTLPRCLVGHRGAHSAASQGEGPSVCNARARRSKARCAAEVRELCLSRPLSRCAGTTQGAL